MVSTRAEVDPDVIGPCAFGELVSRLAPSQTSLDFNLDLTRSSSCVINVWVKSVTECNKEPPRALQYVSATRKDPPLVACVS